MKNLNKTKWGTLGLLVVFALLISSFPVAASLGDIVDYTIPTNIKATVNGYGIQSYNIKGFTAVAIEDLQYYGFVTTWDEEYRTLNIYYDRNKEVPLGTMVKNNSVPNPGASGVPIYKTDINTYINGSVIESFNIGGKTVIFLGSLNVYGDYSDLIWLPLSRTINFIIK